MKSKLLRLADLSAFGPWEIQTLSVENEVNMQINSLLVRYRKLEDVDTIEDGDIVVVGCVSDNPKYNRKKLPLNVGKGLFDWEFEEKLIGLKINETSIITVNGSAVTVTVNSIRRNILPPLSDEIVEECMKLPEYDEPDIKTVDQYLPALREEVVEMLKEDALNRQVFNLLNYLIENSEYVIDDDEMNKAVNDALEEENNGFKQDNLNIEEFTQQQFNLYFGQDINSYDDFVEYCKNIFRQGFMLDFYYCYNHNIDPTTITAFQFNGEGWEELADYAKERTIIEVKYND